MTSDATDEPKPTPGSASPVSRGEGTGGPEAGGEERAVLVRRAPRFTPFLITGALLGVLAAAVLALTGPENAEFTRGSIFGFFAMIFAIPGLLLAGVAVLVLDRISVKKARRALAAPAGDDGGNQAG